jgi:hypothetical protein
LSSTTPRPGKCGWVSIKRAAARDRPLDPAYAAELQGDPLAWQFFQAQPAGFRRLALRWIISARQEATQRKRLASLIAAARAGRKPAEMG